MEDIMTKRGLIKRTATLILAGLLTFSAAAPAPVKAATGYVTEEAALPTSSNVKEANVRVNNRKGTLTFNIYAQKGFGINKKSFIYNHGCAACALTTVLNAYSKKYKNYTPTMTYKNAEKSAFGKKTWKKNYKKRMSAQRPVSICGISKVLTKAGVKNKYVRKFTNAKAVSDIKKHLYKGNIVVIETNNRAQVNGRYVGKKVTKWAGSKHTMVLLGMTDTGKVIVADSSYRPWAGSMQRIKLGNLEEIVKYMIPCKNNKKYMYYHKLVDSGGYILVN